MRLQSFRYPILVFVVAVVVVLAPSIAAAQTAPPIEPDLIGVQPHRDYLRLLPFEHLDTMTGNIILNLPMLTLPGNAGRPLRFELTYNSYTALAGRAPWTFGIAGLAMRVNEQGTRDPDPNLPNTPAGSWGVTPLLEMANGGGRRTMFMDAPNISTTWFSTSDFWTYNRDENRLYMPDGTLCWYDSSGRLFQVEDTYHNTISLDWTVPGRLTVQQHLGGGEPPRVITFDLNGWSLPTTMTFDGRLWQYFYDDSGGNLRDVTAPAGADWVFEYSTFAGENRLHHVVTPDGGEITYNFARKDSHRRTIEFSFTIAPPEATKSQTAYGASIQASTPGTPLITVVVPRFIPRQGL
jgi:hypothetical protein